MCSVKMFCFYFCAVMLSCSALLANGQTFEVTLSRAHLSKIEKAKSARDRLKTYRRLYQKDSVRQIKRINKIYERKLDSLVDARHRDLERRMQGISYEGDTAISFDNVEKLMPLDSGAATNGITDLTERTDRLAALLPPGQRRKLDDIEGRYGTGSKEVNTYLHLLKDSVSVLDTVRSLASDKAKTYAEAMVREHARELSPGQDLEDLKNPLSDAQRSLAAYKNQVHNLQNTDSLKRVMAKRASDLATDMLENNAQGLKTIQEKMSILKKKYGSVLNSNDLTTAVKARSLEGTPLGRRWIVGGNFSVPSTSPFMLDVSPQFGYRIDKIIQVGVSGIYRATFTDSIKALNAPPGAVFGYSLWAQHRLVYNFFGYAEWERASREFKSLTSDHVHRAWIDNLLVGIGRKFTVHRKVNGSVLFLYNPLHENGKSTYPSAFVIKTGFQLSELAFLGK